MLHSQRNLLLLTYVLVAAAAVYVFAHWDAITNPYVIDDDVRQQIYWMQQWNEPQLFRHDLLTSYAKNYVPWGVQALYALASPLMNPVQFTKVVAGILYVLCAGFFFGLGLQSRDELTAIFTACAFCLSKSCMLKISGGLSQSFALPFLVAYLFFLARGSLWGSGLVILLLSVLNPYIFLLCLVTHAIYLAYNHGPDLLRRILRAREASEVTSGTARTGGAGPAERPERERAGRNSTFLNALGKLVLVNIPVLAGVALMALKYAFFKSTAFGELVTRADMVGKVEYTAAGRYEILPIPSVFAELIRPWQYDWGHAAGIAFVLFCGWLFVAAWIRHKRGGPSLRGLKVFAYLWPASLLLFVAAHLVLMKLFLPGRYVEFSLTAFNCVLIGLSLGIVFPAIVPRRFAFPFLTSVIFILAAVKVDHVGIYDYSKYASLYRFFNSTPVNSLVAGNPGVMDDVVTFGRRKAYVTYELSHTWYKDYWKIIKKRTFDLLRAYYARDPEQVRDFCRRNGINYLVIREDDFSPERIRSGKIHFEPFGQYIRDLVGTRSSFAVLNAKEFPPVFRMKGLRVIKPN